MSHISDRFSEAARPILAGDDSISAAARLEGVVVEEHLGDPMLEGLLEALSLYSPAGGRAYVRAAELTSLLQETIASMEDAT